MRNYYNLIIIIFIAFSYNLNAKWEFVEDLSVGKIFSIHCFDEINTCYALSQLTLETQLFKSTDGGVTWEKVYEEDHFDDEGTLIINVRKGVSPHPDYYFISFTDAAVLKKSTDGGKTFKRIDFNEEKQLYEIAMFDENIGFATSADYFFVTFDSWEDYDKVDRPFSGATRDPVFVDSVNVHFISGSDTTWQIMNYNILNNKLSVVSETKWDPNYQYKDIYLRLHYVNENLGFLVGLRRNGVGDQAYDIITRTTDGGKSWHRVLNKEYFPVFGLQDIEFYDEKNGVAVGQWGKFLMTNDGGETWDYNVPNEIFKDPDSTYGPVTLEITWIDKKPIVGSFGGNIYAYEGEFFKFEDEKELFTISGKVSEGGEGRAIELTNGIDTVYSDRNTGIYEFTELPEGNYKISANRHHDTARFYITPKFHDVELTEDVIGLDFSLEKKHYDLTVKFTHNGEPLEGIKFRVRDDIGNEHTYKTDKDGLYKFENEPSRGIGVYAPEGTFEVRYEPSEAGFYLLSDTTIKFEAVYPENYYSVSGRATKDGKGLENARISMFSNTFGDKVTMTDEEGYYNFENVPESFYSLHGPRTYGLDNAFNPVSYNGVELKSDTTGFDFELTEDLYRVSGYARTSSGKGVSGINIRINGSNPFGVIRETTDSNGWYMSDFLYPLEDSLMVLTHINDSIIKATPEYHKFELSSDTSDINFIITDITNVEVEQHLNNLNIHPNPTNGKVNIDIDGIKSVSVYNLQMQEVKAINSVGSNTIDITELPAGVYFLEVEDINGDVYFEKIVKR